MSGLRGPFSLLSLPDPILDFGYAEGYAEAVHVEDRDDVRECTIRWTAAASPYGDAVGRTALFSASPGP